MKASFLWAAAVTFEWHEQERGLATRMTIEGRKHASLADVKDIFFFRSKENWRIFIGTWILSFSAKNSQKVEGRKLTKNLTREKIQWSAEMEEGGIDKSQP